MDTNVVGPGVAHVPEQTVNEVDFYLIIETIIIFLFSLSPWVQMLLVLVLLKFMKIW
jgi:hypothetical protein